MLEPLLLHLPRPLLPCLQPFPDMCPLSRPGASPGSGCLLLSLGLLLLTDFSLSGGQSLVSLVDRLTDKHNSNMTKIGPYQALGYQYRYWNIPTSETTTFNLSYRKILILSNNTSINGTCHSLSQTLTGMKPAVVCSFTQLPFVIAMDIPLNTFSPCVSLLSLRTSPVSSRPMGRCPEAPGSPSRASISTQATLWL